MAKSFNEKLIEILKTDSRFLDDEGELVKAAVIDRAWKIDRDLVKLLLGKPEIKKKFFDEIEKHWIFNINTFIEYISDKNFLANSYTRFRNKIGLTIDDKFLRERGEVSLVWPYKDCVLEGGQTKEEEKRKEIFFNEILAQDEIDRLFDPKVLTSFKRYTVDGEKKVTDIERDENGTIRENLIIKGNNLLALHTLKKQFRGKVKLIYIDPPYNTGGDTETFTYNNSFKHSTWLTFMKNRLEVGREFLRDDGFIAITIDHAELFYLGTLADEIFGRENRIGVVSIVHKPEGRNQEKFFGTSNEFMLVYSKNKKVANFERVILSAKQKELFDEKDEQGGYRLKNFIRLTDGKYSLRENKPTHYYPIYVSKNLKNFSLNKFDGSEEIFPITEKDVARTWKTKGNTFMQLVKNDNIEARKEKGKIVIYEKLREDQVIKTHWIDKKYHAYHFGTKLLEQILGRKAFSFPKSVYAIIDTLKIMTSDDDIILDFYTGSGTTGHATLALNKENGGNRKFILVEQLDEHINICNERVQKVLVQENIDDSFIYCELMKYNETFMDKIQAAKTSKELEMIWKDIAENSFLNWYVNPEMPEEAVTDFRSIGKTEGGLDKQKKLLAELLNKNQLYVNLSEIDDADFKVSAADKKLNKLFYGSKYDG